MYEEFFELMHTPFTRDIPADRLYSSRQIEDAMGRLTYVADRQLFAVVTADPGCGKSTLIRMFESRLPKDKYMLLYLSDSKLTPRWLYAGLLDQMGLEARFYRGDSKRQLQKEIETVRTVQKKKVVFVLDEAHLLGKETLEEFRFLLNYRFDSASPMSLILVGQTELWDQKLRLQSYAAIRQRINMNIVLNRLDRAETQNRLDAVLQNQLNEESTYQKLLDFDKVYDTLSEDDKRQVIQSLISKAEICKREETNGRESYIKKIRYAFDIENPDANLDIKSNGVETVALLSRERLMGI